MPKKNRKNTSQKKNKLLSASAQTPKHPSLAQLNELHEAYKMGSWADAEKQARRITEAFPTHPFAWQALVAILKRQGRNAESLIPQQKLTEVEPQDPVAHFNLANTLRDLDKVTEAETHYRRAVKLKPEFLEAHYNFANLLKNLKRFREAVRHYQRAIEINAEYADAYNNLGLSLGFLQKHAEAEANFRKAIAINESYVEAHHNLSLCLSAQGLFDEAVDSAERALRLLPDSAEILVSLGTALRKTEKSKEAEACFRRAITLSPDLSTAHNNLGNALLDLGHIDAAEESYKRAVELQPDYAAAHYHLSTVKKYVSRDEHFLTMQNLYLDNSITDRQRCHINFALAKAHDDMREFDQAFEHYKEGNALKKSELGYDIKSDFEDFGKLKSTFPTLPRISRRPSHELDSITPIFIVGMPRSGTTLVEQIVSSHSKVIGLGELPFISKFGDALARGLRKASLDNLLSLRHQYFKEVKKRAGAGSFITDKMPHNFRFMGLIAAAFPEAKIVHIKRHPAAVCWANYKQYFESKTLSYSYSLQDIISYYQLYEDLTDHWSDVLGERVFTVNYERMTVSQYSETRRLIHGLELNWEEACLAPEKNSRSVATASSVQVRKKVFQGSSERWKNYEPYLEGVFDNLTAPQNDCI